MKIVICVIFTVYKPEKQVDESTGIKQRSFVVIFRNPSGEEPEVPLKHRIPDCNTFGSALPFPSTNALSHNKYLLPIPTTILDRNN